MTEQNSAKSLAGKAHPYDLDRAANLLADRDPRVYYARDKGLEEIQAGILLAQEYKRLNDPTLLTGTFLLTRGFEYKPLDSLDYTLLIRKEDPERWIWLDLVSEDDGSFSAGLLDDDDEYVPLPKRLRTWGDLNKLCSVLGVTLHEGT